MPSKNNSNQQQQEKETNNNNNNNNINKYQDFFPGFKLRREQFEKAKTRNGKSWPLAKTSKEIAYENFLYNVVNPSNDCFFAPLDENNFPIKMPDNGPTCRYIVNVIQRVRIADGSEKICSQGQIIGYDGASIRRTMGCDKPETWESVTFGYEKDYNRKTKRFETYCTGPISEETQYLLEFNKQNFDLLFAKTWDGRNHYFKPNRRNIGERVVLIVKDIQSLIAKKIFFATLENSIDIFLTRSFEDLMTDAYIPRSLLEQRRAFSAGYLAEKEKTTPTPSEVEKATSIQPDIKNTSAYK